MAERRMPPGQEGRNDFAKKVGAGENRKIRARRSRKGSVWFGLGMMGLVGWSVAVPTLVGIALGIWMDAVLEWERSWTLIMLGVGVGVGCLNAWFWVRKESSRRD